MMLWVGIAIGMFAGGLAVMAAFIYYMGKDWFL